jgi:hypothetical protein
MPSYTFTLLALIASTSAFNLWPRQSSSCPAVWTDVAKELRTAFAGCGRDAHGAIRAPFHDCINNGCDGSLILGDECNRAENAGLAGTCTQLMDWTNKFNVGAADMIQFAAAIAIAECPLGPTVKAWAGRRDSSTSAPVGSVPSSRDSVDKILSAFSAKGFSADDVVALLGTHSVAVQVNDDPSQAGKSLDSTPSTCDTRFYTETKDGTAPYSLKSDKLMSNDTQVCCGTSLTDATVNFRRQHNPGLSLVTARVHGHRGLLMLGIGLPSLEAMSMPCKTARVWFRLARQRRQEQWVCQWAREATRSITTNRLLPASQSDFLHSISFIFTAFMFIPQH